MGGLRYHDGNAVAVGVIDGDGVVATSRLGGRVPMIVQVRDLTGEQQVRIGLVDGQLALASWVGGEGG